MTNKVRVHGQNEMFEMEYFTFGSGEKPFVILPGVSLKSVMASEKAIQSAYRMFGEEYTAYVFDRRLDMPSDYTVRQMADDTAEAMKALGISGAYIFGASQGGMMAMCIAIDHPELVKKAVLGSTAAKIEAEGLGAEKWIEFAEKKDLTALTADFIDRLYSPDTIGKYKDMLIHMNDGATDREIERFIIQTRALYGFDVSEELYKIKSPTFVIGSEGDKVIPPSCSREIADRISDCELYMYGSEFGHCVFDEAPDYKQRIMDFFIPDCHCRAISST